jgi:hypothetical protein
MIPDTDEDLNWHAFLGHSIDMQGFRAAEFAGVDLPSKSATFLPLNKRGIGVRELGELWDIPAIRNHLEHVRWGTPMQPTYEALRRYGGSVGMSLADALETFPWRKGHRYVRALLQNSAVLGGFGYSYRTWLQNACIELGVRTFPPPDFLMPVNLDGGQLSLERALRAKLERAFFLVGQTMSPYMLCDWQLWLWNERKTGWFASFKLDAFHQQFVRTHCGTIPADEEGFVAWWRASQPDLPPRLANECIWLGMENKADPAEIRSADGH